MTKNIKVFVVPDGFGRWFRRGEEGMRWEMVSQGRRGDAEGFVREMGSLAKREDDKNLNNLQAREV